MISQSGIQTYPLPPPWREVRYSIWRWNYC